MAFSQETIEILKETLPVYYRKGQGGTFPYVKGEDVIRQLNKAFGHAWSSEVINHQEIHGQILVLVAVKVLDTQGVLVTHQGFGSSRVAKSQQGEYLDIGNSYKSAYTTALKKAAEQFGIGLEGDEEDATAAPPPRQYTPPPQSAQPPRQQQYNRPAPAAQQARIPPAVAPSNPAPAPKPAAQAPMPSSATSNVLSNDKPLSDVQKNALRNLSKVRGISEEALVTGALGNTNKRSFDQLTEKEAVEVIRYSNSSNKK